MEIVEFQPDDEKTFLSQCRDFYGSAATLHPFDTEKAEATFRHVMEKHENAWGFMLVDKALGEPVGYALLSSYWCNEEGGDILVLDELYISPKSRHNGYGSGFLKLLEERFRGRAKQITLEVLNTNQPARSLYAKDGMAPDGFTTYSKDLE